MEFQVRADEEGLSPLQLLQRRIPSAPCAYLRRLLRSGKIVRRGGSETAALRAGESLHLPDSARLREFLAQGGGPEILLETGEMLVVYKPAGVAVHRGVGHEEDNLDLRVEKLMSRRKAPFRTAPVHRLDAGTSGPVLFAKGRRAAAELGKLFMAGEVEKLYLGLAAGTLPAEGRLAVPVHAKGKNREAETGYKTVQCAGGLSLLELQLFSGRTHQIRRQLAGVRHPLAGDLRYRGPRIAGLNRPFLHCRRLAFTDPFTETFRKIESPLPHELAALLAALGFAISDQWP